MHAGRRGRRPAVARRRLLPEPVVHDRLPAHPVRARSTASSTPSCGCSQCFASQAGIRDYMDPDFVLATARYWSRFGGGDELSSRSRSIRDAADLLGARAHRRGRSNAAGAAEGATTVTRVLVTGAGGPAGVAVIRSLLRARRRRGVRRRHGRLGQRAVPGRRRTAAARAAGPSPDFVDGDRGTVRDDAIDVLVLDGGRRASAAGRAPGRLLGGGTRPRGAVR